MALLLALDIKQPPNTTVTNPLSNHLKTGVFSPVSQTIFSSHIESDYTELVDFIDRLFKFLEDTVGSASGAGHYLNTIRDNRDIDMIEESLLNELQKEVGNSFPRNFAANTRLFYKKIIDFYLTRGTPESIKAFFRYLYNDNVDVYFPRDALLIPSDGRYFPNIERILESPEKHTPLFRFTIGSHLFLSLKITCGSPEIEDELSESLRATIPNPNLIFVDPRDNPRASAPRPAANLLPTKLARTFFHHQVKAESPRLVFASDRTIKSQLNQSFRPTINVKLRKSSNSLDDLFGPDDNNRTLIDIDTPLIFKIYGSAHPSNLQGTRVVVASSEYNILLRTGVGRDEDGNETEETPYKIVFTGDPLLVGDVIEIYSTGAFSTNDGFLSDHKRIQDSFYYQSFSYVLRTGTSGDVWRNPFNQLAHPAGFAFFSEILFSTEIDFNIPDMQPGRQRPADKKYLSLLTAMEGHTPPSLIPRVEEGTSNVLVPFKVTVRPEQTMGITVGVAAEDIEANKFLYQTQLQYFDDYTIEDAEAMSNLSFESTVTTSTP